MARRIRIFSVPRLSMRFHATAVIAITLVTAGVVTAGLRAGALAEAAITGAAMFAVFQTWFTLLLHHGVRYDSGNVQWSAVLVAYRQARDAVGDAEAPPELPPIDVVGGDDPLSVVLSVLAAIVLAVCWAAVLAVLLWLGLNALLVAALMVAIPLYWLFRRSLRAVAVHIPRTRGDLFRSALTALRYSLPYALALTGIVWAVDALAQRLRG